MPAQSSRNPVKRTDQTTRAFPWWRVTALAFAATAFAATQVAFSAMVDAQPQAIGNVASTTRHHVTGLKDTLVYQYPNSPYFQDDGMIQINVAPGGVQVSWFTERGCQKTSVVVRYRSGQTVNIPPISDGTEEGGGTGPIVYVQVNADNCPEPSFVGMAPTPDGKGYWLVENNGVVENFGDALFEGDAEQLNPNKRAGGRNSIKLGESVVAIAAAANLKGYWVETSEGVIYKFGNAKTYGTFLPGQQEGVTGMATTPDKKGYYLVYQEGNIAGFGDSKNYGEVQEGMVNGGVVGMSVDQKTGGYWLASANGDVAAFNAPDDGSLEGKKLSKPIVGIEAAPDGSGYRLVSSTGRVFCFKEKCEGDLVGRRLAGPVVGIVADGVNGYWILDAAGQVFPFGGARGYGNGKAPY